MSLHPRPAGSIPEETQRVAHAAFPNGTLCLRIAAALDRLHVGGWSVGDTAFHDVDRGGIIHVVIGSNSENQIRAEGATCREAWRRALCFTAHRKRDTLTLCPGVASTRGDE